MSALVVSALLFSACGGLGGEGSRHQIYASLEELIGDSALIVAGTVSGVSAVNQGMAQTAATVSVAVRYFPEDLGRAPSDGGDPADPPRSASSVRVLQVGTPWMGPAPTLQPGSSYLLFLSRSGLDGDFADVYFVTGGVAGMYRGVDGTRFTRVSDEDPGLPATITRETLDGWNPTRP
ncbi:MAG: hypothetical protein QM582_09910 [Micropruina sp.]